MLIENQRVVSNSGQSISVEATFEGGFQADIEISRTELRDADALRPQTDEVGVVEVELDVTATDDDGNEREITVDVDVSLTYDLDFDEGETDGNAYDVIDYEITDAQVQFAQTA